MVDSLKRDQDVWDVLTQEPISRSLPQGRWLTKEVANLLAKVLEEGNVLSEPNKEAETCYKRGWLHRMQILGEDGYDKEVYVLPSRLHEKHVPLSIHSSYLDCIILTNPRWIEHYIAKRAKSLPSEFQNLRDLTLAILQEFSSSNLRHSAQGKTLSSGAQPKPIEAQYQDEFYRCFNRIAVEVCQSVPNGLGPQTVESIFGFLARNGQWRLSGSKTESTNTLCAFTRMASITLGE